MATLKNLPSTLFALPALRCKRARASSPRLAQRQQLPPPPLRRCGGAAQRVNAAQAPGVREREGR